MTGKVLRGLLVVPEAKEKKVSTSLYSGVSTALSDLANAGHRLAICTNKPLGPTRAVLRHFGLTDRFKVVIGGDSLPQRKPFGYDLVPRLMMMDGEFADAPDFMPRSGGEGLVRQIAARCPHFSLIPAISKMGEQFSRIRRLNANDTLSVEYVPKRGTVFYVNGQPAGLPIADANFFPAILRVWLGTNPTTQDLKDALLDQRAQPVLEALL